METCGCNGTGLNKEYQDWSINNFNASSKDYKLCRYCHCSLGVIRSYFNANRDRVYRTSGQRTFQTWYSWLRLVLKATV